MYLENFSFINILKTWQLEFFRNQVQQKEKFYNFYK